MKIAAIITGQTRHFWYTLPSVYERVIKPNNIDCFVMYNKDSSCDYQNPQPIYKMDEDFIIKDILGESLKYITDDSSEDYQNIKLQYIELLKQRIQNINVDDYGICNFWFLHDIKKVQYLVDEWLKIKVVAEKTPNDYDIILRIRMDIPFYNEYIIDPCKDLKIYFEPEQNNIWAKEYFFYAPADIMKKVCTGFIDYLFTNVSSWRRGDEELCLVNEVQFGKFLHDCKIQYSMINKEHRAGKFYTFHNLHRSKYYHLSNAKDKLICYLDAGTIDEVLNQEEISTLYD